MKYRIDDRWGIYKRICTEKRFNLIQSIQVKVLHVY